MATALHKCLSFSVEKVVNYNRSMKFGRSEINAYTYTNFVKVFSCAEIYRHAYRVKYEAYTRSVRKVSDRIFLCEHLMDYNLARLHEPTLNLSAHA